LAVFFIWLARWGSTHPCPRQLRHCWHDVRNTLQVTLNILNLYRSEHLIAAKQAQICHWISAMMIYEL